MTDYDYGEVRGLAILCDSEGHIIEVLYDQLGLSDQIHPGTAFSSIVDEASSGKADLFLETLHQQGLALNWELNVPMHTPPIPLLFAGTDLGDTRLILGSASYQNILRLFEELSKINSEQVNAFRNVMKRLTMQDRLQQDQPSDPLDSTTNLYNELSAVNNQLANTQRALAKVNAELRMQRDRFQVTLASIGDAVVATDTRGMITFMNPAAEELLGSDEVALKGKLLTDNLLVVDQATREPIVNSLETAIREKRATELLDQVLVIAKDSAEVPIDLNCAPIQSRNDEIIGFVINLRDITASKLSVEKELQLSAEREKVQILTNFIRDASHDLRTPLTIMWTSLDLLERYLDPDKQQQPDKQQRHIQKIRHQMAQLLEYIEALITMAQLDATTKLKLESIALKDLVEMVLVKNHSSVDSKNQALIRELDAHLPHVSVNPHYFDCALDNIVRNAIFYTPERGQITIRTFSDNAGIYLEITDTGIGIDKDQQERIFDRFYRVDASRSKETGGSGLGLALAKKIVDLHNGTIEVESAPGRGSTFRICLPLH